MARARSLPKTAVEHCYQMADEICLDNAIQEPVSGFNSETAIRIRLRNILNTLEMLSDDLVEEACDVLMSIDILNDAPKLVTRRCEQMLASQLPDRFESRRHEDRKSLRARGPKSAPYLPGYRGKKWRMARSSGL